MEAGSLILIHMQYKSIMIAIVILVPNPKVKPEIAILLLPQSHPFLVRIVIESLSHLKMKT